MTEIMDKISNAPSAMEMANAIYQLVDKYTEYHDDHYDDDRRDEPEMPEWMMTIQQGVMGLMSQYPNLEDLTEAQMGEFKNALIGALDQAKDQMPEGAHKRFMKVAEESTTMQELM